LKAPYVDVSKLDGSEQGMFSKTYMSSKITEMMHILKMRVRGQKTIIFVSVPEMYDNLFSFLTVRCQTHFVSVIPSITHALCDAGIRWTTCKPKREHFSIQLWILIVDLLLDSGDMSSASRESSLKKIAQDDKCTVIIVSIMAGGVGMSFKFELRYQWRKHQFFASRS